MGAFTGACSFFVAAGGTFPTPTTTTFEFTDDKMSLDMYGVSLSIVVFVSIGLLLAGANAQTACSGHGVVVSEKCVCDHGWAAADCSYQQKSQSVATWLSILLGFTGAPYFYLNRLAPAIVITIVDIPALFILITMISQGGCGMLGYCLGLTGFCRGAKRLLCGNGYSPVDTEKGQSNEKGQTAEPAPEIDYGSVTCDNHCGVCSSFWFGLVVIISLLIWWAIVVGCIVSGSIKDGHGYPMV
jgi:hypothetical protein